MVVYVCIYATSPLMSGRAKWRSIDGSDYSNAECCPTAVAVSFVEGGYLK